jgi:hypothetical protein
VALGQTVPEWEDPREDLGERGGIPGPRGPAGPRAGGRGKVFVPRRVHLGLFHGAPHAVHSGGIRS